MLMDTLVQLCGTRTHDDQHNNTTICAASCLLMDAPRLTLSRTHARSKQRTCRCRKSYVVSFHQRRNNHFRRSPKLCCCSGRRRLRCGMSYRGTHGSPQTSRSFWLKPCQTNLISYRRCFLCTRHRSSRPRFNRRLPPPSFSSCMARSTTHRKLEIYASCRGSSRTRAASTFLRRPLPTLRPELHALVTKWTRLSCRRC